MSDQNPEKPSRGRKPKPESEVKSERLKAKREGEKPKAEGEVKGERQKMKGGWEKPKAAARPKAVSSAQPVTEQPLNNVDASMEATLNPGIQKPEIENKSEIENPKSEILSMEVHHHPQLDHKPKPIKEYLLEGLMIFIAVMMGFIAENVREYIDNNEQVKHLTTQLVQDLRADTAQLSHVLLEEDGVGKYNDTLINLLQQPLTKTDTRQIQKMIAYSHSMWIFHPSGGALEAIRSQIHLRQFSNSDIIGYFAKYEKDIELEHTAEAVNLQYQRNYLDPFLTAHFIPANVAAAFAPAGKPTAQMRNLSQTELDQLATDVVLMRQVTTEMIGHIEEIKTDATALLKYVQQHFDVE